MMDILSILPNKQKAIFLAKRHLAEFVTDAVNLEGINFTLPEVQTLLQGVTVGGHKLSDQTITLNQAKAWEFLFHLLETEKFKLAKDIACQIHDIAAKEEALSWGKFRDGQVTIAGTHYMPPEPSDLNQCWNTMVNAAHTIDEIYDRAIYVFLQMARNQFFYDVNKRMGRFMMNGILLAAGYPAINLSAKKQLKFNELMLDFYQSNDVAPMTEFMKNCLDPRVVEIMKGV